MTPSLICSHTVCTVTCEEIDKRSGLADVNGTRVVTVAVSHTHSINTCSQCLPIRSHYETCSNMLNMNSIHFLCNLKPLCGQTSQNSCTQSVVLVFPYRVVEHWLGAQSLLRSCASTHTVIVKTMIHTCLCVYFLTVLLFAGITTDLQLSYTHCHAVMAAWLIITGFGSDDLIYWQLLLQSLVITINYINSQSIFRRILLPWLPRTRPILVLIHDWLLSQSQSYFTSGGLLPISLGDKPLETHDQYFF
jgi:hypothetical protein